MFRSGHFILKSRLVPVLLQNCVLLNCCGCTDVVTISQTGRPKCRLCQYVMELEPIMMQTTLAGKMAEAEQNAGQWGFFLGQEKKCWVSPKAQKYMHLYRGVKPTGWAQTACRTEQQSGNGGAGEPSFNTLRPDELMNNRCAWLGN